MELHKYRLRFHKKTDLTFNTLIECNEWLIKQLKTWKGTPIKIELIERKVSDAKQQLEGIKIVDPALERVFNPGVRITLNGHQNMEVI